MEDHIRAIIYNNNLDIYEKCEAIENYTKGTEYEDDLRYNIACALSAGASKEELIEKIPIICEEYIELHNSHKS